MWTLLILGSDIYYPQASGEGTHVPRPSPRLNHLLSPQTTVGASGPQGVATSYHPCSPQHRVWVVLLTMDTVACPSSPSAPVQPLTSWPSLVSSCPSHRAIPPPFPLLGSAEPCCEGHTSGPQGLEGLRLWSSLYRGCCTGLHSCTPPLAPKGTRCGGAHL